MTVDISQARMAIMARRAFLEQAVANLMTSLGAFNGLVQDAPLRGAATFALGLAFRKGNVHSSLGLACIVLLTGPVVSAYREFRQGAAISASRAFQHTLQLCTAGFVLAILIMGRRLVLLDKLRRQKQADAERLKLL